MTKNNNNNNNNNKMNKNDDWQKQLKIILNQRRGVGNFKDYTVSEKHAKRMQQLAESVPEVYNNPSSTPRSKWFDHPNYRRNSQMPMFHVHFRQEMQSVLAYLEKAHTLSSCSGKNPYQSCKSAFWQFQGCMGGLNGHVSIEEYAWFPVFQNLFPKVDLRFLFEDHEGLHRAEDQVMQALQDLTDRASSFQQEEKDNDDLEERVVSCIQLVMDFDQQLMGHLGEEEEILMPMSLTFEKRMPL
ncbi:unnamed protein product [Cylindrotheca closterium]|uniref:Hemerythrin-like domain-containing protein n=1 Tax=Cylindrotheca closterium TaxID=2856 RepID=A0AAD2CJW9_9STRA|nr:unnamed protein product [Cylindrotheca closterium]